MPLLSTKNFYKMKNKYLICKNAHYDDKFSHETKDCTVRALTHAFKVEYSAAHQILKEFGRKDRRGCNFRLFMEIHKCKDDKRQITYKGELFNISFIRHQRPHMTVKTFVENHPKGIYIIRVPRRVFAIVDGKIYDCGDPGLGRYVGEFWEVGEKVQKEQVIKFTTRIGKKEIEGSIAITLIDKRSGDTYYAVRLKGKLYYKKQDEVTFIK